MEIFTLFYDREPVEKRAIDIASPAVLTSKAALFYVHGGGWRAGSRDLFHSHLHYFSQKGFLCASAGYRLVPEVILPDMLEDVALGYNRFLTYIEEERLEIEHIIVLGSSAGAHLASLLALVDPQILQPKLEANRKSRRPTACVSINGPGTLEKWASMHAGIKRDIEDMLGVPYESDSPLFREASPILHVDKRAADFLFLIVGQEQFFPHRFVYEMSDRLQQCGNFSEVVLLSDAEHGFFYGVTSPNQLEGLARLEPFLERYS